MRRYRHDRLILAAFLLAFLRTQAVNAQATPRHPPARPPVESPTVIAARASFEQGVQMLQDSQFAQAAALFERSYQDNPVPVVLFNLAFAYRGQGRTIEALRTLERFVQSPANTPADRIASAREEMARLTAMIAHVNIARAPADAQVAVDARPAEGDLSDVQLDPGTHVIDARRDGYRPFRQELTLAPGARQTIIARLTEIDDQARLRVEPSVPTARITIDGAYAGTGSVEVGARAGMHQVDIEAPGYLTLRRSVQLGGVGLVRVDAVLQRPRSNPWPWLGPVIAVGAASAIALSTWGIAEATRGEVGPIVDNCWNCVNAR